MKLRLYGASIRFRFDSQEVARLSRGEALEAQVRMGPVEDQVFRYRVVPVDGHTMPDHSQLKASMDDPRTLTVSASLDALGAWNECAGLALAVEQTWPGGSIKLALEKDMQRLNPKPEEESAHAYPNPQFGKAHCVHP